MTDSKVDSKIVMNSGTYGCVFYPAFIPKQIDPEYKNVMKYLGDPSKYVNKYLDITEAKKEIKFSEIFTKIDPDFKYLLYPLNYIITKPDIPKVYLDKCKDTSKDIKNFVSIYLPYGGMDITDWMNKYVDNKILIELCLIKIIIQTVYGLLLMHKHGIVHLDIKTTNFLITEIKSDDTEEYLKTLSIRYIDYGLSHNFNESKTPSINDSKYELWPYEFIMMNDKWKNDLDEKDMKDLYKNEDVDSVYPDPNVKPEIKNSNIINVYKDTEAFLKSNSLSDFYKKTDIHMLGTYFNWMYTVLKIKKGNVIKKFINNMRNIYVSKRYSDEQLRVEIINIEIMLLEKQKELISKKVF